MIAKVQAFVDGVLRPILQVLVLLAVAIVILLFLVTGSRLAFGWQLSSLPRAEFQQLAWAAGCLWLCRGAL